MKKQVSDRFLCSLDSAGVSPFLSLDCACVVTGDPSAWKLGRPELPLAKEKMYISQTPCLGAISVSFALWWIRSLVLNSRHDYLI